MKTMINQDCLFLISLAFYNLQDYLKAETAIHNLLTFDPENEQGKRLQELIKRKKKGMEKDGILGLAVAGGLSLAVGGLLGLGVLALGLVKSRR